MMLEEFFSVTNDGRHVAPRLQHVIVCDNGYCAIVAGVTLSKLFLPQDWLQ